jgi:ribonuclease HI
MTEQVAAFVSDSPAPIVFMVPRDNVKPKHEPDHVIDSKVEKVDSDEPHHAPSRSEKAIRIFMEYQLSEASEQSAEWGVVIYKTDIREMTELHILKGKIASKNWMFAPLAALVEALKAISHEDVSCAITVETTHEFIVKGMDGGDEKKAFRTPESIAYWNDIDALSKGRDIRCRSVAANLSDNLQNICDMAIQRSPLDIV